MRRVHRLITAGLAVSLIGLAPTAGATPSAATPKVKAIYAASGPYAAGVTTVTIGDRQAEVWYPIAKKSAHGKHKDVYEIVKWLPQRPAGPGRQQGHQGAVHHQRVSGREGLEARPVPDGDLRPWIW